MIRKRPSRKRLLARAAIGVALLGLAATVSVVLILQSSWFFEKVRHWMIGTVETATGGRVEIGSLRFDWKQMRAEVREFAIHGSEAADKPPLVRAGSVAVGLKLVSLFRRDVDIQYLRVSDLRVYLIVGPDGGTNVPAPKLKSTGKGSTIEDILKLAIGSFTLERGMFEVEAKTRIPFDARGENLNLNLAYELAGPRYRGTLAIQPLALSYDDYGPVPFSVNLGVTLEKNRVSLDSGRLATGTTQVELSGAVADMAAPHGDFRYEARVALPDIARIFRVPELRAGRGLVSGNAKWTPALGLALTGNVHATGVEYRDNNVRLVDFRADGTATAGVKGVDASGVRIAGFYAYEKHREPVEGRVGSFALRHKDIDLHDVALALLTGSFRGDARVRNLESYLVTGEFSGIDSRRTIAIYSAEPLPWDALVFGPVRLEGSFKHAASLRASASLRLAPAPGGDAVTGEVNATYLAQNGTLDLGRSTVTLPHSRVDVSGAIGGELKVHAETRDLNDILPVLGKSTASVPVALRNGSAVFDGSVTGNLKNPRVAGHIRAAHAVYAEQNVDTLEGDVVVSADYLRVQNASAAQGPLRAQFQGSVGLSEWKTADGSPIAATATLRNAGIPEIAAVLKTKGLPVTGTLNGSAQVNGTLANPHAQADLEVLKGQLGDEPFDRFTAHAAYGSNTLEIANGQLTAGAKEVRLSGTLRHAADHFDTGRVRFEVSTNAMSLPEIRTLTEALPGMQGTVQMAAGGEVELQPAAKVKYSIHEVHADLLAKGVQLDGQALGDTHLTASSQGEALRAHLDSTLAGSAVKGDGEWRLGGDLPGTATVSFGKVDLVSLAPWLQSTPGTTAPRIAGFMEGTLRIDGPVLDWRALKAELRIPQFQLGPAANADIAAAGLTVKNAAPMVVRFANSTVTVESAHLVGRGTDVNIAGRVLVEQKSPLDLRIDGRIDLGLLQDFSSDFISSGGVVTNASVKGSFGDPQIAGRLEFKNAALNIVDVPNGISNATGLVLFTKDRATIQSLKGETGGGAIDLSGFASYGSGQPVFRIHASAREVRVRYPEGVSTVANASLNFTGTAESSMLAGTVTILRTGVNLQSDFSSILAKSAEPVRTPSARQGLLGGLSFDVQIETAPDIQLESSLTENLQAEANLRLRGTASNPAVLGRINITQGKLTFFGTQYTLNQGSISFFNPVKVEPVLNIDLETKARGIDITLSVSGPLNKLSLTPRSDPPLQFSEIVALLATGRAPTSDPSLLRQQSSDPQSWQQMGASALLGSAIANPVAGRLQRFFGVSKLRIDPTLSGVENNPQARLTLEQQVTPSITFTYITNVTSSNPQVVRVEWAMSKQFSAVALREENGLFGLDFFYKKRFK